MVVSSAVACLMSRRSGVVITTATALCPEARAALLSMGIIA
jgi:hypothetical protein